MNCKCCCCSCREEEIPKYQKIYEKVEEDFFDCIIYTDKFTGYYLSDDGEIYENVEIANSLLFFMEVKPPYSTVIKRKLSDKTLFVKGD